MSQQNTLCSLRVNILKIRLKVRFSCTVSCSLKVEGREYEIPGEAELKNGEAIVNWKLSQTLPLNLNKSTAYPIEKKCALLIYLKSTAGKIPAGTVALNLSRSVPINSRELCSIDKCPDKNAVIEFDFSFERIQGRLEGSNESLIEKVLYPINSQSYLKKSTSRENLRSPRAQQRQNPNSSQIKYLRGSKAEGSIAGKQTVPLRRMPSKRGLETRYSLLDEYYSHERQRDSSQQKVFGLEREVEGTRTKLSLIEQELSLKCSRVGELEKEAREACKKIESLELEVRSGASKIEVLEKTNRDLVSQIKQIKEKQEEDKLNFQNALKRVQIRQISSKQQIKSLTEKLYASENEKQKMLFEKSLSYNEFEDREKKLRQAFKDKEKKLIEEKSTLIKKMDALQRQASKNSELLTQAKTKNNEALQTTHQLELIVETLETQNQRYRNEASDLRYELTKSRNEKKILQENLENHSRFNEQRRNYRKQINQKEMELTQLKEKCAQLENQSSRTKTTTEEAQKTLKEKNNQLKLLQRDYSVLLKEHHFVTAELSSKDLKLSSLLEELQGQMKKTKLLESKIADLENKLEEQREALQLQSAQSKNRCSALEEEIQKLNNDLFECHSAMQSVEKENEQLQQLIDQKNELIHNLESNLIQLNDANQAYQLDKLELAEERKEVEEQLLRQVEEAQNYIKQLSNELQQLNQTHPAALYNVQRQLQIQKSVVNELNGIIKEKQQQIAKISSKLVRTERQLENFKMLIDEKSGLITSKEGTIAALNTQIKNLKKKCEDNQAAATSLRTENIQIDNEVTDLRLKLDEIDRELVFKQKELKKSNSALQNYKSMAIDALNVLSSEIDCFDASQEGIQHCDSEFQELGNNVLKKIRINSQKAASQLRQYQRSLAVLQKKVTQMEQERDDKQLHLLTTHKDLELLKKSTHEFNCELQNKVSQVELLRAQFKKQQQDFASKSQEYQAKIAALNKSLSEKNKQIADLKQRTAEAQRQLQNSQDAINQLENRLKKFEREKKFFESDSRQKVNQIDSNLREEIEKVNTLESEKANLERDLKEEKTNVRKALRELQNKCFELQQMENKFAEYKQAFIFKESECNRYKLIYNQLRQLHEFLITAVESPERTQFLSNRFEACSRTQLKENVLLFDKTKQFYQSITVLAEENRKKDQTIFSLQTSLQSLSSQLSSARRDHEKLKVQNMKVSIDVKRLKDEEITALNEEKSFYQQKATRLENQMLERQKERLVLRKQHEELKAKYEEQIKQTIKQKEFILEVIKFAEEQKELIQIIRKLAGEVAKTLTTLQKEKKVSMFAVTPLKEPLTKLEEIVGALYKSTIQMMSRHKREWDLAAFRKKKLQKKTSLELKPI